MREVEDYINKALIELRSKSLQQIQVETALTWCGRACAASVLGHDRDAVEYGHEALEHAALSGSDVLLRDVREAMRLHAVEV